LARPTAVILVVGLTPRLIGEDCPQIEAFARRGRLHRLRPVLPAVTCSVQSSMVTGLPPAEHGIVGNGWYNREMAEVQFWKQSNHLVRGEKVWETARRRDPAVTCGNFFWWYNMYSSADVSITPRPMYKADGRKLPDVYSEPPALRHAVQEKLGTFPLFQFWGPAAGIASSRWIADAAMHAHGEHRTTLTLIYLPHLDYALQRVGPHHEDARKAVREVDEVVGDLLAYFEERRVRVMLVSEYGIEAVDDGVRINRHLREEGVLRVRDEEELELLDAGASAAFAVADHQVAHVYVADESRVERVRDFCAEIPGVEQVLDREAQRAAGIDHERAGELVLVAEPRRWFSYDYWLDDARAPDFARTVDIHRKPGYDPCELLIDPRLAAPKVRLGLRLAQKTLGFRALFDVIPLDPSLVRGSHGRVDGADGEQPVMIVADEGVERAEELPCTAVRDVILEQLFGGEGET
jgi:predicted AlkP superfamily pyrophosphatase or phosphodiesterase